jgi:hypothetical protein
MSKKFEIATTVLALVGVVVAVLAWRWPVVESGQPNGAAKEPSHPLSSRLGHIAEAVLPKAVLSVSGTGARVEIRESKNGVRFSGSEISSTDSSSVVYLPLGQPIVLKVSGTGAKIAIASALTPYIEVNNSASGASVVEY